MLLYPFIDEVIESPVNGSLYILKKVCQVHEVAQKISIVGIEYNEQVDASFK